LGRGCCDAVWDEKRAIRARWWGAKLSACCPVYMGWGKRNDRCVCDDVKGEEGEHGGVGVRDQAVTRDS
jgi:hypothetical protein